MAAPAVPNALQQTRRLLYLYGAVTQLELNGFLEGTSIDSEERKRQLRTQWRAAAERFADVTAREQGEPETIETKAIPDDDAQTLRRLRQDADFAALFSSYPVSFESVKIDKIVASQRTVHLEHVEKVQARFEEEHRDLFTFCVLLGQDETQVNILRSAQSAFTLSSDNPALRFLGVYERNFAADLIEPRHVGGQPRKAVILIFGYGASTVNAYRVGRRIILNNGFHRLYALRAAGVTHAPMVIQQITHPQLELPPTIADLPREYLVENRRPALMKDFFDHDLTCEIVQRNFLKAIQIAWGTNETLVPR